MQRSLKWKQHLDSWHLRFKQSRSYSPQRELLRLCLWWERRKPFMMQAHISLSSGKVSTCLWRALPTDCSVWLGGTAQKSPCKKSIMSKNGRWWLCSSTALAVSVWWSTPTGSDCYPTEKQTKPISRLLAAEQAAALHTQTVAATLLQAVKHMEGGLGMFLCATLFERTERVQNSWVSPRAFLADSTFAFPSLSLNPGPLKPTRILLLTPI